jgi:hypothetical protein
MNIKNYLAFTEWVIDLQKVVIINSECAPLYRLKLFLKYVVAM